MTITIDNKTDQDWRRLLVLYASEINMYYNRAITRIVFEDCKMSLYNANGLVLEVDDSIQYGKVSHFQGGSK